MKPDVTEIHNTIDDWVGSDPDSVRTILDALYEACCKTASHLTEDWQDRESSRDWERIAKAVDQAGVAFERYKPY